MEAINQAGGSGVAKDRKDENMYPSDLNKYIEDNDLENLEDKTDQIETDINMEDKSGEKVEDQRSSY